MWIWIRAKVIRVCSLVPYGLRSKEEAIAFVDSAIEKFPAKTEHLMRIRNALELQAYASLAGFLEDL